MHDSQSFHHSDNHFLPHPFLFFVPESKKSFLYFFICLFFLFLCPCETICQYVFGLLFQYDLLLPERLNTKQLLFFCVTYIKKDVGFSQDMYHNLNKKH